MWGNLAGRLGATDINATLEKIGNAVAPREESDDEYHDDDDGSDGDYDDDEYDEDEDYGDGNREGIMNRVSGASPFRLAGMLTQVLDQRHPEAGILESNDNGSNIGDENSRSNIALFPNKSTRIDQESVQNGDIDVHIREVNNVDDTLQRADEGQNHLPIAETYQSAGEVQIHPTAEDKPLKFDGSRGEQSTVALPNIDNPLKVENAPTGLQEPEERAKTHTLMDTAATKTQLPLIRTDIKIRTANSTKASSVATNQVSTNKKSPKRSDQITPEIAKSIAQQPVEPKGRQNSPTNSPQGELQIVAENKREEEDEVVDFANNVTRLADEQPQAQTANVKGSFALANGDDESRVDEEKNDDDATTNSKVSTPELKEPTLQNESDAKLHDTREGTQKILLEADLKFKELKSELEVAKQEIVALKNQAHLERDKAQSEREDLIAKFHSKEARLLQATSEESQNQTLLLQQEYSAKIQSLENSLVEERKESQEEQAELKRLLRESYSNVDRVENQLRTTVTKYDKEIAQVQQREERALRMVDDRMAQTMAVLDERDEEIKSLKKSIKTMASKVNEHQEGEEEAEEELEEVHQENESLRQTIEKLEFEKKNLKDQVATLKSGSEELSGLQMELTMLKEERGRERTKNQAVIDSAMSSRTQLEIDRDNALSELRDSKQQLAATLADLEISRADYSRIIMANDNLQSALEAFQDERRAEMEMIEEQRLESEEAIKSAHATATSALKQIHENEMYEIQKASDNAVKNVMHEMELVEGNLEKLKSAKNQMRRSLDEAIHRLQTTQEDVIDRNVMKNILLDWCTLNDKSKRHQVLEVMANLLHFSEDEKEKVHLTSKSLDSVRAKVVGALAAPFPPSKADVEHLEGSNVHEKWVNFLMAETDDV
jgi:hypothetical protein